MSVRMLVMSKEGMVIAVDTIAVAVRVNKLKTPMLQRIEESCNLGL